MQPTVDYLDHESAPAVPPAGPAAGLPAPADLALLYRTHLQPHRAHRHRAHLRQPQLLLLLGGAGLTLSWQVRSDTMGVWTVRSAWEMLPVLRVCPQPASPAPAQCA